LVVVVAAVVQVEFDGDPAGFLPCSIEIAEERLDLVCRENKSHNR